MTPSRPNCASHVSITPVAAALFVFLLNATANTRSSGSYTFDQELFNCGSGAFQAGSTLVIASVDWIGSTWARSPSYTLLSGDERWFFNSPPIADASATPPVVISANGTNATILLNGTRSSDPDGDPLEYAWYESGAWLLNGVVALRIMPVGAHTVQLLVSDGELSATHAITVEVLTAAQAVDRLAAAVGEDVSRAQPLVATLTAALASIDRNNPVSAINQLLAFQDQVRAQVEPLDAGVAAALVQAAQEVIDAVTGGATNSAGRPHGRFTSVACDEVNGVVRMQFSAEPGPICILEASTNLVDWEMIGVAADHGDGTFECEDPDAARFPSRYYRLVTP